VIEPQKSSCVSKSVFKTSGGSLQDLTTHLCEDRNVGSDFLLAKRNSALPPGKGNRENRQFCQWMINQTPDRPRNLSIQVLGKHFLAFLFFQLLFELRLQPTVDVSIEGDVPYQSPGNTQRQSAEEIATIVE